MPRQESSSNLSQRLGHPLFARAKSHSRPTGALPRSWRQAWSELSRSSAPRRLTLMVSKPGRHPQDRSGLSHDRADRSSGPPRSWDVAWRDRQEAGWTVLQGRALVGCDDRPSHCRGERLDGEIQDHALLFTWSDGKEIRAALYNLMVWKPALVTAGVIPPPTHANRGRQRFKSDGTAVMHASRTTIQISRCRCPRICCRRRTTVPGNPLRTRLFQLGPRSSRVAGRRR